MKLDRTIILKILFVGIIVAVSLFSAYKILLYVPFHPDEHQFYYNAFSIMDGKPLHNYLHVAFTEYMVAIFFSVVNMITDSGINFPNGLPSHVTFYYGRVFGFGLYILGLILGIFVLQKGENKIKNRSIFFTLFYFASLGLFERFIRVNSDSMIIIIYLYYLLLSISFHKNKSSVSKFFLLNTTFIFLGTFTNMKSLFLFAPVFGLNLFLPIFFYHKSSSWIQNWFKVINSLLALVFSTVVLWSYLMPRPYDSLRFWYTMKKTIIHGTQFDFDYPSQSFNSWAVYIYDLFVEYIGLVTIGVILIYIFILTKRFKVKLPDILSSLPNFKQHFLVSYNYTEILVFLSMVFYYIGISTRVVHWSRWNAPTGFLAILLLSIVSEKIWAISNLRWFLSFKVRVMYITTLLVILFIPKTLLLLDIYNSGYPLADGYKLTEQTIGEWYKRLGLSAEEGKKQAIWFTGHSGFASSLSIDDLPLPQHSGIKYVLWPYWNIGLLHTEKIVDKDTTNQRAFIDKYAKKITYEFPTYTSYYMHYAKLFAWKVLGITWNPELDSLVESQYGIVELNEPIDKIELSFDVKYRDMAKYYSPYSLVFNLKNLPDSYMFPPCYTYPDVVSAATAAPISPPAEFGVGGRTAGLYCYNVRFRILFRGYYKIRVENMPEDPQSVQRVFSNMGGYKWDPKTKTIFFYNDVTRIPGDFGVALKEKNYDKLKFHVFYKSL